MPSAAVTSYTTGLVKSFFEEPLACVFPLIVTVVLSEAVKLAVSAVLLVPGGKKMVTAVPLMLAVASTGVPLAAFGKEKAVMSLSDELPPGGGAVASLLLLQEVFNKSRVLKNTSNAYI